MKRLMKKRMKALAIDMAIAMAVSAALEPLIRNNLKQKALYDSVAPSLVFWGLEYMQLRKSGQTIGHKVAGIIIDTTGGSAMSSDQILKSLLHRDSVSIFSYLKDHENTIFMKEPNCRMIYTRIQ